MPNKNMQYAELTDQQMQELCEFAKVEGRRWKSSLRENSWWRGIPAKDRHGKEYPSLYGLRNTHGPSWLLTFSAVTK